MNYIINESLISEKEWKNNISLLETPFKGLEENKQEAIKSLEKSFRNAIKKRATKRDAVLLSGGVDSSIIALLLNKHTKPSCYAVGLKGAEDLIFAKKAAKELDIPLNIKELRFSEIEDLLNKVIHILKTDNVVKISVGAVLYSALSLAKKDDINKVFSGLGSEEIFCGYQRHSLALLKGYEQVHKECWTGLKGMWEKDLTRDYNISSSLTMKIETPFLDKEIITSTMRIHPRLKINKNYKKIILRELALKEGLSKELSWRKKKAAQYGSKFDKTLIKLAKVKGYKYKKNYLKSML